MIQNHDSCWVIVTSGYAIMCIIKENQDHPFALGKTPGLWCSANQGPSGTFIAPSISITYTTQTGELKKLDVKYIPDVALPVQSDWNNIEEGSLAHILNRPFYDDIVHKTYTFKNVPTSGQASATIGYIVGEFVTGESYTVNINGVDYALIADDNGKISDGTHTILSYYDEVTSKTRLHAFTWWPSGATVSISGPIHILKKLDGKFIDGVTSLNGEIGDVTIDCDKLGAAPIEYDARLFYNLNYADQIPASFDWIGDNTKHGTGLICGDTHIFNKYDGDTPILYIFNSEPAGTQSYYRYDSILRGIESPKNDNDAASKLYVDNSIAKADHVKSPTTATVGQILAVKSVDSTNKPTEWEAVEIPASGDSALYLVDAQNPNFEEAYAAYEAGKILQMTNLPSNDSYTVNKDNRIDFYTYIQGTTFGNVTFPSHLDFFGLVYSNTTGGYIEAVTGLNSNNICSIAYQPLRGYLTEHQDISGKLDASELPQAINTALEQAKASGEFKGDPGDDYVLTEADKQKIAELTAPLVEVPEGGAATMRPLTFTGAVNATYDGSVPVSVEIPQGGGGGAVAPELLYAVTAENVVEVSQDIDWKGHTNFYIVIGAEKESGNAVNIKSARLVLSNVEFTFGYYTSFLKDTATKGSVSHELRMVSPNHCACVYGSYTFSKDGTTGNFTLQGSGSACPTPKISGLHGKATVIPNTADGIRITLSAEVPSLSVWVYGF